MQNQERNSVKPRSPKSEAEATKVAKSIQFMYEWGIFS